MEDKIKAIIDTFSDRMIERFEEGERKYGEYSFNGKDMFKEMEEELLDVANYALMQYIKLQGLKDGFTQIEEAKKDSFSN